jgi:hypothetical protein
MLVEQRGGAGLLDHQQPEDLSTLEHAHLNLKKLMKKKCYNIANPFKP